MQPAAPIDRSTRARVWWANPLSPLVLIVLPTLFFAWRIDASAYLAQWKAPKVLGFSGFARGIIALLALAIGATAMTGGRFRLAEREQWPLLSSVSRRSLRRSFFVFYRLTCFAYVVWAGAAVARGLTPQILVRTVVSLNSFNDALKTYFATIPGITTMTQFAICVVIIGVLLTCDEKDRAITRRVYLLVGLAVVRAFLRTERLAVVELVVPWLVIRSAHRVATTDRSARRLIVRLGPILALPLLLIGFSLFEYSRSWTFARETTNDTFVEYSSYRLIGYYATSYNNGELYRQNLTDAGRLPYFTTQFVWDAPIISSLVTYEGVVGRPAIGPLLSEKANPEFNSEGGLSQPYVDFGDAGGALYFLASGLFIGWMYRLFAGSRLIGMLSYPMIFVSLLEMPRYLYWSQGRATPGAIGLVLAASAAATSARRASSMSRARAPGRGSASPANAVK